MLGYERIEMSPVGDSGFEVYYAGPSDEEILQKISAPGLKMNTRPRTHGPTKYDWVADGDFDGDDCHVHARLMAPDSWEWRHYMKEFEANGKVDSFDLIRLNFSCGSG